MGFRKVPVIYTLTFEGEYEGLEVRMKSTSLGKMRQILNLLDSRDDDDESMNGTFELIDSLIELLIEQAVSWNMEDEQGRPIEFTSESLNDQDLPFVMELTNRYMETISGPDKELGKDSPGGKQSPVALPTMEAL